MTPTIPHKRLSTREGVVFRRPTASVRQVRVGQLPFAMYLTTVPSWPTSAVSERPVLTGATGSNGSAAGTPSAQLVDSNAPET
jgi:hypothetical protein